MKKEVVIQNERGCHTKWKVIIQNERTLKLPPMFWGHPRCVGVDYDGSKCFYYPGLWHCIDPSLSQLHWIQKSCLSKNPEIKPMRSSTWINYSICCSSTISCCCCCSAILCSSTIFCSTRSLFSFWFKSIQLIQCFRDIFKFKHISQISKWFVSFYHRIRLNNLSIFIW